MRARVEPLDGALGFRQVTETRRWKLTKTWITDPARATVLARVRFTSKTGRKLKLYVLADPAPGDDGNDDRAASRRDDLVAWDDSAASAVAAAPGFTRTSSGYRGTESDPWQDLQDGRLRGWDASAPGNVVQGAETQARRRPQARPDAGDRLRRRRGGGRRHRPRLARPRVRARRRAASPAAGARTCARSTAPRTSVRHSPALRRLYEQSLMVLAASEDKVERGASIAAPNMPWVWGTLTLEGNEFSGPYHLVWPRDFYHVATAQKAAGDDAAATRLLDYLWRVQKPDGSWWQNTRVDGTEYWTSLQLDEVALPVVLAWWLDRRGEDDWKHIRRAADFIVANGPKTAAGALGEPGRLVAEHDRHRDRRPDLRRRRRARRTATRRARRRYEATADEWQAARSRPGRPRRTARTPTIPTTSASPRTRNPDDGSTYSLGDNFPRPVDEREIVDNSFLGLVLFGAKPWDDPVVRNSLAVGDEQLASDTPSGRMWHRFSFDGYGETADRRRLEHLPDAPSARRSGACGRCSRASAASTSCSPAATPGRTCRRSPTPPTTG